MGNKEIKTTRYYTKLRHFYNPVTGCIDIYYKPCKRSYAGCRYIGCVVVGEAPIRNDKFWSNLSKLYWKLAERGL